MISETETERRKRIERHMQDKIDYLKTTTDGYKGAIDRCDAAELSSYSWIIATQTKDLKDASANLNKGQEEQFDNLQRDYVKQFDRLRYGHCECKPKIKEQRMIEHG